MMRSNRRRNSLIKRIALGLAIAAFAAPVAQARVDEGISGQQNSSNVVLKAIAYRSFSPSVATATDVSFPRALPSDYVQLRGDKIELIRSLHRSTGSDVVAADYGMPRAMPHDYALSSGDQIEVVRATPRGTSSDKIEFVRAQPRETGEPQLASRFGQPNATTGDELASWNVDWQDAGIGAGLALALLLLGGGAALASRHVGRAQTA
jgi:hypothetical protein